MFLPFRRSNHLSYKSAVHHVVSERYEQHPDQFLDDLKAIDSLRRDAINVRDAHTSGIFRLQAYAAQLVWMGTKFPLDIGCDFTWYPAFGYNKERPIIENNYRFELINVLFNLAALYSQLSTHTSRADNDGRRVASSYLMQGAGVLLHIKEKILPELRMAPPEDMDEHVLDTLSMLMLAQAQECFWHKAIHDKMSDGTIARLAAQVSDFYANARDAAVNSATIDSIWIRHMEAKRCFTAAAAQYRAACECLEKRKYGEEVARLKDAVTCVTEGLNQGQGGQLGPAIIEELQELKRKLEEDLKRAEKDNDLIYLKIVPPKSDLSLLRRAKMASPKCPSEVSNPLSHLGEKATFGPGLFAKLVPFVVHLATSIYEEKRNHLVIEEIVPGLETLIDQLTAICQSLNIPGIYQAFDRPLGLPSMLVRQVEELRQANPIEGWEKVMTDRHLIRDKTCQAFENLYRLAKSEMQEDEAFRRKYGTDRWLRPASNECEDGTKVWDSIDQLRGYIDTAVSADDTVCQQFNEVRDKLVLLTGPQRRLLDHIPSSRQIMIPEPMKPALNELRAVYNNVLKVQSKRRRVIESVKSRWKGDNINADIRRETSRLEQMYPETTLQAWQFDDFFEKRLEKLYHDETEFLKQQQKEQEEIHETIMQKHHSFEMALSRQGGADGLGGRERQDTLQSLYNAYNQYKKAAVNAEEGKEFWNKLSLMIGTFVGPGQQFVDRRRREAQELEAELEMPPLSTLSLSKPASSHANLQAAGNYFSPQHQPPLSQQAAQGQQPVPSLQEPPLRSCATHTVAPQQPRPVAPTGTRWTPDMGIKFGTPEAGLVASPEKNRSSGQQPISGTWKPESGIRFG